MELKTNDKKQFVTDEEYLFLQEAKRVLAGIRNTWFKEGRILNKLTQEAERLKAKEL